MNNVKKFYYIYKTTNIVNGKFYVGRHKTDNLNDGYIGCGLHNYNRSIRSKTHFGAAVRKYGYESFKREIIEFCDNNEHYIEREQYWLDFYKKDLHNMYNKSQSSSGGYISEEAHEKAASKNRGQKRSKEFCEQISKRNTGRKLEIKKPETECCYCGFKSKSRAAMNTFHGSNCLKNPNKEEIKFLECEHCGHKTRSGSMLKRYHGDNCKSNPNLDVNKRKEIVDRYAPKRKVWTQEMKDSSSKKKMGVLFSEEAKLKMSEAFKNGVRPVLECPHCNYKSAVKSMIMKFHFENCLHAPVLSESAKLRLSKIEASKPKGILSDQIRKDISERMKNQVQVRCPFCLKSGSKAPMYRYHFENCKRKK